MLFCVILLARVKRGWPVLRQTLLVAGGGTLIATIVLWWPSPPGIFLSQWLNPAIAVIIPVVGYGFASRAGVSAREH